MHCLVTLELGTEGSKEEGEGWRLWMRVEREHDPCQDVMLHYGKSWAAREPCVFKLHWDDVT